MPPFTSVGQLRNFVTQYFPTVPRAMYTSRNPTYSQTIEGELFKHCTKYTRMMYRTMFYHVEAVVRAVVRSHVSLYKNPEGREMLYVRIGLKYSISRTTGGTAIVQRCRSRARSLDGNNKKNRSIFSCRMTCRIGRL